MAGGQGGAQKVSHLLLDQVPYRTITITQIGWGASSPRAPWDELQRPGAPTRGRAGSQTYVAV